MDFALTETQREVAELATKIFQRKQTPDELWTRLAEAGFLEPLGVLEWCSLLAAAGAAAAPVPLWAVTVATMTLDHAGTHADLRADVARGARVVVPSFDGTAELRGNRIHGVRTCVPAGMRASHVIVPAAGGLFLVDTAQPEVALERQTGTTGETLAQITLRGAPAEPLGPLTAWMTERATVGLCAMELGICEHVLALTAKYTSERVQFDRPIATFQAVAQRAADAYIDVETIRLTTWEAAWRLAAGLPAARELAIAKFFAAEGGQRVTYAAQHLHGGIGFDLEYGLARYYPLSKQIELTLGGANAQLASLGALLYESRPSGH